MKTVQDAIATAHVTVERIALDDPRPRAARATIAPATAARAICAHAAIVTAGATIVASRPAETRTMIASNPATTAPAYAAADTMLHADVSSGIGHPLA
jgi:hypothetical protein